MTTPSSISSQVTNTPSGPSGVRGLGDTFAADLHSGTGRFSIPFTLPAGHAGLAPSLGLVYSSGAGAGVAGAGWSFGLSSIRRRTDKGIPTFHETDVFVLGGDELVPVGHGEFVRRQEGSFARIRRVRDGGRDFWSVTTRNGTRHLYGYTQDSRDGDQRRVTAWRLCRTEDANGNRIDYRYTRGPEDGNRGYLSEVVWGEGVWSVELTYEARPDVLRSARTGVLETTSLRLRQVDVQIDPALAGTPETFDRYVLGYVQSERTGLSLLESVQRTGVGPNESADWPQLSMEYTQPSTRLRSEAVPGAPRRSLADGDLQLIDFDGNALPDLLRSDDSGYVLSRNDGQGGFLPEVRVSGPTRSFREPGVFLSDLYGKGFADLITPDGFYDNVGNGFGEFRRFVNRPPVALESAYVRISDVDGDGRPDVLHMEKGFQQVYRNEGPAGWSAGALVPAPDGFPSLTEANVRLVDFTGDGLDDMVRVHRGMLEVWHGLGNGRFAPKRELLLAEQLPFDVDLRTLRLVDVTGTGAADLVIRVGTSFKVYANGCGESLLPPVNLIVPGTDGRDSLVPADLNGTGVRGLLLTTPSGQWRFCSLWEGEKPDILKSVDNGMGSVTSIRYGSSVAHAQRDRNSGRRWRFPLPYPVRVVDEVRTVDQTTGFETATSFRYHEGYHDSVEREYRGFGIVEQLDRGMLDTDESVQASRVVTFFSLGNGWTFDDRYTPVPVALEGDQVSTHPDARRATRGRPIRVETFGEDEGPFSSRPYSVVHSAYSVRMVSSPREDGTPGSFYAVNHVSEAFHFERTRDFRRLRSESQHDRYGRVVESREIGFGRRLPDSPTPLQTQQATRLERVTRVSYAMRRDPYVDEYEAPYEPSYLLDAPIRTEVFGVDGAGVESSLSATETYYDGVAFEGLGYDGVSPREVTRGRVSCTMTRRFQSSETLEVVLPSEGWLALGDRGHLVLRDGDLWSHASRLKYDSRGRPVEEKDPRGAVAMLSYGGPSDLFPVGSVDAMGHETTLGRAPTRPFQVTKAIDPNGNVTLMEYDARSLLTSRTVAGKPLSGGGYSGDSPTAPTETMVYDFTSIPVHIEKQTRLQRLGAAHTVHHYLDGAGRTIQERHEGEVLNGSKRWRVTGWQVLDTKGNVVQAFQPTLSSSPLFAAPGSVPSVRTDYDPLSRAVRVEHPDGSMERVTFHPWTQAAFDRNDLGVEAGLESDPRYNGSFTRWALQHENTPTLTHNDAFGRAIAVDVDNRNANGTANVHRTRTELDLRDHQIAVYDARDANNASWLFTHDESGALVHVQNTTGTGDRWSLHDAAGLAIWSEDARQISIHRRFDLLQRPLSEHTAGQTKDGLRRQWTYAVYQPNNSSEHQAIQADNLYGPPAESRDADGLRTYVYDHRGLVLESTLRVWDHDWSGPSKPLWSQGDAFLIPDGTLGTLSFTVLPDLNGGTDQLTTTTTYDSAGRSVQVVYPNGFVVEAVYNESMALDSVLLDRNDGNGPKAVVDSYLYDARGKVTGWTLSNGVETERTYDPELERLTRLFTRKPSGAVFQDLNYSYDAVGNPADIRDDALQAGWLSNDRSFTYDPRYRLIRATGRKLQAVGGQTLNPLNPTPSNNDYERYDFTYAYDAVGNLVRNDELGSGTTLSMQAAAPDLFDGFSGENGGSNYTYDANGNTTKTPRHTAIEYSFDSQPILYDLGGGGQVVDLRHGDQRCVRFSNKTSYQTMSVYLGPWEYHARNGSTARSKAVLHIHGAEKHAQATEELSGSGSHPDVVPLFFVHGDHLGSGQVLTDVDGKLLSNENFLPFGRSAYRSSERNRYRFIGVERDVDTGLCMTGPRTYDPLLGRFLQPDPLVQPGEGPFVYASGNPVGRLDPGGYADFTADQQQDIESLEALRDQVPEFSVPKPEEPLKVGSSWDQKRDPAYQRKLDNWGKAKEHWTRLREAWRAPFQKALDGYKRQARAENAAAKNAGGMLVGGGGPEMVQGFHGTGARAALAIIESGELRPGRGFAGTSNDKVQLSRDMGPSLVHGADSETGRSWVLEVSVLVPPGIRPIEESTPNVPRTVTIPTSTPLPTEVVKLYERQLVDGVAQMRIHEGQAMTDRLREVLP